jgi:hypothetical protein
MNEKLKSYHQARQQFLAAREAIKKDLKGIIAGVVAEVLQQHPDIRAVRWAQYTPYFNDGDACTFSRGDAEFIICAPKDLKKALKESYAYGEGEYSYDAWSLAKYAAEKLGQKVATAAQKGAEQIAKVLDEFGDDDYRYAFGDHVQVTVTPDGKVDVEEYSHD